MDAWTGTAAESKHRIHPAFVGVFATVRSPVSETQAGHL